MFKKLLLGLLLAASAGAGTLSGTGDVQAPPSRSRFTFGVGDTTDSRIFEISCPTMRVGFYEATGGDATFELCTANDAATCASSVAFTASDLTGQVVKTTQRWARWNIIAAPSAGVAEGRLFCSDEVASGATGNINELADVDTVSSPPAVGNVLGWNGSQWIPTAAAAPGAHAISHEPGGTDEIPSVLAAESVADAPVFLRLSNTSSDPCAYIDFDGDSVKDFSLAEQCIDGGAAGGFTSDGRKLYCQPETFEHNGTSVTDGVFECIEALNAIGGGTVMLGPRSYFLTGAQAIDLAVAASEITIVGAGSGSSALVCRESDGCTVNTAVVRILSNSHKIRQFSISVQEGAAGFVPDAVWVGDGTTYPSDWDIDFIQFDGDVDVDDDGNVTDADEKDLRIGRGIYVRGLEGRIGHVIGRWFEKGIVYGGKVGGRSNHIGVEFADLSSMKTCIDTTVGTSVANQGDTQQGILGTVICQNFRNYALHLRGGSADATNFNSFNLDNFYAEASSTAGLEADSCVKIEGSASAYDPMLSWDGGTCTGSLLDGADADSDSDAIVADAAVDSPVFLRGPLYFDSQRCITHRGTGKVYYSGFLQLASTCNKAAMVLASADQAVAVEDWARLDAAQFISGAWATAGANGAGMRSWTHATSCPDLVVGILGDRCFEQDAETLYICEPSAGGCDSAGEWKLVGGAGSGDITDVWGATSGNVNALTAAAGDSLNAAAGDSSIPATGSTSLPGTCTEGQEHRDTDSGGSEVYICVAANTWLKLVATIASGTAAMGTGAISSGLCAAVVTVAAAGVLTTDVIQLTPNADISGVTGYNPVTTGALIIYPYPTTDNVNFKVCNPTTGSVTPGAVTLNWRVSR